MKVLIYPNTRSKIYARIDIANWVYELIDVCTQSDGAIEPFVLIENGMDTYIAERQLEKATICHVENAPKSIQQLNEKYHFEGILVKGRNKRIRKLAQQMNIFYLAFAKAPHPLDTWVIHSSWHHDTAMQISEPNGAIPVDWAFCGGSLNLLPLVKKDYSFFSPYRGSWADVVYDRQKTCVVVPLYRYFRLKGVMIRNFLLRLKSIVAHHGDVTFLLVPMSPRADRMRPLFETLNDRICWLEASSGRNQILSLMQKADAVIAFDSTGALLPLMMNKPTCRDPKLSLEISKQLPGIACWLKNRISAEKMKRQRDRLVERMFSRMIVPKHSDTLLRFQKASMSGAVMDLAEFSHWNTCCALNKENEALTQTSTPTLVRKFRKLKRDPYAYCNDSSYTAVRMLKRIFDPYGNNCERR